MTSTHVSNLGGAFIFSEQPEALAEWYRKHLGIGFEATPDGSVFYASFPYTDIPTGRNTNMVWSIIRSASRPRPVSKSYMINYRVFDADKTAAHLRSLGVEVKGVEAYPEGKFAWCTDADGNEIELWEDSASFA